MYSLDTGNVGTGMLRAPKWPYLLRLLIISHDFLVNNSLQPFEQTLSGGSSRKFSFAFGNDLKAVTAEAPSILT